MNEGQWIGVFASHVWMLSQTDDCILYKSFCMKHLGSNQSSVTAARNSSVSCSTKSTLQPDCDHRKLLEDYFQLSVNLQEMYKDWGQRGHCISCCCHLTCYRLSD